MPVLIGAPGLIHASITYAELINPHHHGYNDAPIAFSKYCGPNNLLSHHDTTHKVFPRFLFPPHLGYLADWALDSGIADENNYRTTWLVPGSMS